MSISELIAQVSTFKKVELGEREEQILASIADGLNTAYNIHSYLKKRENTTDYKNVTKRVRRLHELKLITEVRGESAHGAKFYTLSTEGLFYLLVDYPISPMLIIKHKDNIILKSLLYPFFEEQTIEAGGDNYEIGRYLKECCHILLSCVDYMRKVAKHPLKKMAEEKIITQLQTDLEWQAKSLAFNLLTKRTDLCYAVEPFFWPTEYLKRQLKGDPGFLDKHYVQRFSRLPTDKKFIAFARNLGKEYEHAFSHLVESAQKYHKD